MVQASPVPHNAGASPAHANPWLMGMEQSQLRHGWGPIKPTCPRSISIEWTSHLTCTHLQPMERTDRADRTEELKQTPERWGAGGRMAKPNKKAREGGKEGGKPRGKAGEGVERSGHCRQCLLIFCLAAFGATAPKSWSRSALY